MPQISEGILFQSVADRSHFLQSLTEEEETLLVLLEEPRDLDPCSAALTAGQSRGTSVSRMDPGGVALLKILPK